MTDNQPDSDAYAIVEEMADLLSKHKLVPFFGAGISFRANILGLRRLNSPMKWPKKSARLQRPH
ncbi:hypothetical protein [Burkholderia gladioli]|uniref:hypothetical protein n=1 Tax=Burkholderia gladioli TaxID=28095 RepID=UPI00136499A5|nr:hypothetical protein [Burkholderia gladioli]